MKLQKLDSKIFHFLKNIRIAVLVLGTAILFYACKDNIDEIKAFNPTENLPVQEATNFTNLSSDSGQIRFSLKTPKLLRYENEGETYIEFPIGMQIIKYDANKNITSTITADYAKQFVKDKRWEAKNNVVVTNEKGDSLLTEHLIWEEKTEKIHTEEFVRIISADKIIKGLGLTSDQNMLNWRIENVTGVIYITMDNKKQPAQIEESPSEPKALDDMKQQKNEPIKFK
jgi:LPS export ABC transporter protein LptC